MEIVIGIIIGVIALTILVALHELGHGIVARRNGVVVEEFGIGFPPRAWGKKLKNSILGKNVDFTINWLPLGGFVKLQGEHDAANKKGDYGAASFWVKTKVLLAGVFINWLTAAVLLTILAITGLPQVLPNQFSVPGDTTTVHQPVQLTAITPDYPAAKAGFQSRDKILRFAGHEVKTASEMIELSRENKGETVDIIYSRGGVEATKTVTLRNGDGAVFGAGLGQMTETRSTWSAPIVGVGVTWQLTVETLKGIGTLIGNLATGIVNQFSGDAKVREAGGKEVAAVGDSVAGPIGIFGILFPAAQQSGPTQLVLLVALISIGLAVMNALPVPALDGGRWFTMAAFRVFKKKLTKEREEKIQAIGFMTLMALVVLVTVADVGKIIK
jgi:regulator of sigma E protease